MSTNKLRIKDLEGIATRSAIGHWQRVGLLPDAREAHQSRGYRVFDAGQLPRIREIARLRKLGLSCQGIKKYFEVQDAKLA